LTPVSGRPAGQLSANASKKLEAINSSLGPDPSSSALARSQALINAELLKMRGESDRPIVRPPTFITRRADGTLLTGPETLVPHFPEKPNRTLAYEEPLSNEPIPLVSPADVMATWDDVYEHITFVPLHKRFEWLPGVQDTDPVPREIAENKDLTASLISALRQEAQLVQGQRDAALAKALKLENSTKLLHGGYEARLKKLIDSIEATWNQLVDARLSLQCFEWLRELEVNQRIPARLQHLRALVRDQKQIENSQQSEFVKLTNLLDELVRAKQAAKA